MSDTDDMADVWWYTGLPDFSVTTKFRLLKKCWLGKCYSSELSSYSAAENNNIIRVKGTYK